MITQITGRRASGKTLLAVKMAQDAIAQGKEVWADISITGTSSFLDWQSIRPSAATIILDVTDMYSPSLTKADEGFLSFASDKDLICVVHYPSLMPAAFRDAVSKTITPRMEGDELIVGNKRIDAQPLYSLYDTRSHRGSP